MLKHGDSDSRSTAGANAFKTALLTAAGATTNDTQSFTGVKKIVFGLLSDETVRTAISDETVSKTKTDIGATNDTCYAYYDANDKIFYIVPEDENATGFIFNENSSRMFYYFSSLTEIQGLELADTSKVTSMSYMFYYC